jgi:hypothetical protein
MNVGGEEKKEGGEEKERNPEKRGEGQKKEIILLLTLYKRIHIFGAHFIMTPNYHFIFTHSFTNSFFH